MGPWPPSHPSTNWPNAAWLPAPRLVSMPSGWPTPRPSSTPVPISRPGGPRGWPAACSSPTATRSAPPVPTASSLAPGRCWSGPDGPRRRASRRPPPAPPRAPPTPPRPPTPRLPAATAGQARVAAYARRDHYAELEAGLEAAAAPLRAAGWVARVVADDNALVDRAAAVRAGLGWYGKNANVLLPGRGSWFVLGSVVTDAPLPVTDTPVADGCGSCTRCLTGCPTGAIVEPGVVDARRCLAWLVQAPGPIPVEFRRAVGGRLYGCDECQEVCPVGRAERVDDGGVDAAADVEARVLLDLTDEELLDRFGRWYIAERDPRHLRRNALVVLGNTPVDAADSNAVDAAIARYLTHPDPLLRSHAVWATAQRGRIDLLAAVGHDADPMVRDELLRAGAPVPAP